MRLVKDWLQPILTQLSQYSKFEGFLRIAELCNVE